MQAKSRFSAATGKDGSGGRSVFCGKCAAIMAVAGISAPTFMVAAPFLGALLGAECGVLRKQHSFPFFFSCF